MPSQEKNTKKKYYRGIGRRKTSTSTIHLYQQKGGGFLINEKELANYFPEYSLQKIVTEPLSLLDYTGKFLVLAKVSGGGKKSQAEAIRHGIARALVVFDEGLRKQIKSAGYLTRDSRMRERKKPGLKRARRAPQWRKR